MKQVKTFLNEEDYKLFKEKAKELHLSEYALVKKAIIDFMKWMTKDVTINKRNIEKPPSKVKRILYNFMKWMSEAI